MVKMSSETCSPLYSISCLQGGAATIQSHIDAVQDILRLKSNDMNTSTLDMNRETLVDSLNRLGITSVVVSFNGSYDNGYIEEACAYRKGMWVDVAQETVLHTIASNRYDQDTQSFTEDIVTSEMSLVAALEHFTYDWLANTGLDWYNNDGGEGRLTITISSDSSIPCRFCLHVGLRETNIVWSHFRMNQAIAG